MSVCQALLAIKWLNINSNVGIKWKCFYFCFFLSSLVSSLLFRCYLLPRKDRVREREREFTFCVAVFHALNQRKCVFYYGIQITYRDQVLTNLSLSLRQAHSSCAQSYFRSRISVSLMPNSIHRVLNTPNMPNISTRDHAKSLTPSCTLRR